MSWVVMSWTTLLLLVDNTAMMAHATSDTLMNPILPMNCPCTVTQGNFTTTLPFFTHPNTATGFYAYNNPLGSCANTGLEVAETMLIMLYENSFTGEISLILIQDIPNDPTGGTLMMTVECMSNGTYVAVSDDDGELTGSPPTFTGNFTWSPCCTDGGVINGLSCGQSFIINIQTITGIGTISLVSGDINNVNYENLPDLACPIYINCGGQACCDLDLEIEADIKNASCGNSEDGEIALSISGECTPTLTYLWSNGSDTNPVTGLGVGQYTVTISDPNGCTEVASFAITNQFDDPIPAISGQNWYCAGQNTELYVNGNYTGYQWSTGATTYNIIVDQPGTYSVTVTGEGGCTGSAYIEISEFPLPQPIITGPVSLCENSTAQLDAGSGYGLYLWNTGETSQTINISGPGVFYVEVYSNDGCPGVAQYEVLPLPTPDPEIYGDDTLCVGQVGIIQVDDIFNKYLWSTGDTFPFLNLNGPGIYTITVTNEFGCTGTESWTIASGSSQPLFILGDTLYCTGDSVQLYASNNFQKYSWSTGDSTLAIWISQPGQYVLKAIDQNGCEDTASIHIDIYPLSTLSIQGPAAICPEDTILIFVESGYNAYLWSNGSTTHTTLLYGPGTFFVQARDSNGCMLYDTVTISLLPSDTTTFNLTSCNPLDTGQMMLNLPNQYGCDSIILTSITYAASDTTHLIKATCDPSEAGVTETKLKNSFGCDSLIITTTLLLPSDTVFIHGNTCDLGSAGIMYSTYQDLNGCDSVVALSLVYIPPDVEYLLSYTCDINLAKTDTVLFMNSGGCDSLVITEIRFAGIDTTRFTAYNCDSSLVGTTMEIWPGTYCDSVIITETFWAPYSLTSEWKFSCNTTGPMADTALLVSSAGCDSLHITYWNYSNLDLDAVVQHESCQGSANGQIAPIASGGQSPYQYSLDSIIWYTTTPILNLVPGNYTLFVRDNAGCIRFLFDQIIMAGAPLVIDIGPDITVDTGAVIDLGVQSNMPISIYAWQAVDNFSCNTCPLTTVGPVTVTQQVLLAACTPDQCQAEDNLLITVREITRPHLYLPSSFSPNHDGINDRFSVYGNDQVLGIGFMAVYDRWGNALYEERNLAVNDPAAGWDGTYRNKRMDPGVYVFVVEVVFTDGTKKLYKGDITLMH